MKKIYIFLASSIVELQNERAQIENFIRKISDDFEEQLNEIIAMTKVYYENQRITFSNIL